MKGKPTVAEANSERVIHIIIQWMSTRDGAQRVSEVMQQADETNSHLCEEEKLDPKVLREPVTI